MTYTTILVVLVVAFASIGAAGLAARMMQYRSSSRPEDADTFQMARYAPMARLLDPSETAFLAAQPGMDRSAVARFQRERRQVFRMYLKELSADFRELHAEARQIVAVSPEPNHQLVETLMSVQFRFWSTMAAVEIKLALAELGIGRVNPARLLETVQSLSNALARATAVPGPIPVN